MRKWRTFEAVVVVCGGLFFIQSCCKAYCLKQFAQVDFVGFDSSEIDTFLVAIYEPNGLFDQKIDSSYTYLYHYNADTIGISLHEPEINLDKDLEFKLPGASRVFRVTNIDIKKTSCNCGPGSTKEIKSCTVNGAHQSGEILYLRK